MSVTAKRDSAGWSLIDQDGVILAIDPAFCSLLAMAEADLQGRNLIDFTAPADRDQCLSLLQAVIDDPTPLTTTKRIIRADGAHVWVTSRLSRSEQCQAVPCYEVTVMPLDATPPYVEPQRLLDLARVFAVSRRKRRAVFGTDLFTDPAWDILVTAYIHEAEGRTISIAALHADIGLPLANASRWLRALSAADLVEYEDGGHSGFVTAPFRLSKLGHDRFERVMSETHRVLSEHEQAIAE